MDITKKEFEIGVITGVHGIKGEIKIFPYTSDPENIARQKFFLNNGLRLNVEKARVQGKFIIVKLDGISCREEAEKLKGQILQISREHAALLSENVYYMDDLIGCSVFSGKGCLGVIKDILETGANDVYSVFDDQGKEILIPAIKSVVKAVDIEKKRIEVLLPEGLMDEDYI